MSETTTMPLAVANGSIYDNVVMMFLWLGNWETAMAASGFDPSDKEGIKKAQTRLSRNRDYFENFIKPVQAERFTLTEFKPALIQEAIGQTLLDHATNLKRTRNFTDAGQQLIEIEVDTKTLLLMEKGAAILANLEAILAPKTKEADAITIV